MLCMQPVRLQDKNGTDLEYKHQMGWLYMRFTVVCFSTQDLLDIEKDSRWHKIYA